MTKKQSIKEPTCRHTLFRKLNQTIISVLILGSCTSSCSTREPLDFKTPEQAIDTYRGFLVDLKKIKSSNTKEFTNELVQWKNIEDTVFHFLQKDTIKINNQKKTAQLVAMHDSVKVEFMRIAETWRYSYDDVIKVKEKTSSFSDDKDLLDAVEEAKPFFFSLNEKEILKLDKKSLLSEYRVFLKTIKEHGISNQSEMLSFIELEDLYFRSFLTHLRELSNEPLADITHDTEAICKEIFLTARNGRITAKDAMIYMSMRTARRLLQNSVACMTDINSKQIKDKNQESAYIWMIIQPFISIDQFTIATLTPQERSDFKYIMNQLPKSYEFAKAFGIEQKSLNYLLPQQLMKIYVLSL